VEGANAHKTQLVSELQEALAAFPAALSEELLPLIQKYFR